MANQRSFGRTVWRPTVVKDIKLCGTQCPNFMWCHQAKPPLSGIGYILLNPYKRDSILPPTKKKSEVVAKVIAYTLYSDDKALLQEIFIKLIYFTKNEKLNSWPTSSIYLSD